MTVREVNGDTIVCEWFDKQDRLKRADFLASQLKEDQPKEDSSQTAEDVAAALLKASQERNS